MNTSSGEPFDFDVSSYGPVPTGRGLFVTGTGTGVGKTLIAGAIARHLRQKNRNVEVLKPVATGCYRTRGELISADAEFLAACAETQRSLDEITPVRYVTPAAPNVAAQREGRPVDLECIFSAFARAVQAADAVIVEGIGGLLCPITDDFWVIHLAKLFDLPLVIVADAALGTINHTLTSLHAARCAGLRLAGVVINRYCVEAADLDVAMMTNPAQIAQLGKVNVLTVVPQEDANCVQQATIGPDTEFAIDQVDWQELMGS